MLKTVKQNKQRGAVSLFVVVFFAIMITVVTIGFIVLMVRNQRLATNNDLSQSAYDSALAGAEDGKKIIDRHISCLNGTATENCEEIRSALADQKCLNLPNAFSGGSEDKEIKVASGADLDLDQAYTCLKIKMDTPDYLGKLAQGGSEMIPLKGVVDFKKIKISWFSSQDLASDSSLQLDHVSVDDKAKLMLEQGNETGQWGDRPAVLKAQLIQYNSDAGIKVSDFDQNTYNSSLYLYPSSVGEVNFNFNTDNRRTADNANNILAIVRCDDSFTHGGYACQAEIDLPDMDFREAYLHLTTFYVASNFKVALLDDTSAAVNFQSVQPEIDSTGRANDLFRRVKVRANLFNTKGLTGIRAVEVLNSGATETGDFKKNFIITP